MAGGSGFAGLVVTGLVSALVAFGVAALLSPSPKPGPADSQVVKGDAELRREVERLRREVEELRSARGPREAGTTSSPAPAAGASTSAGGTPGIVGLPVGARPGDAAADEEGPLPANRKELLALIDRRVAEKAAQGLVAPERKRVSIEEAGAELGLSAVDVDSIRRVWRDSEQELVVTMMGTSDLEAVKEELRGAKDDPDRKAALINKAMGNAMRNLGRLATVEDRRDRDLKRFLTDEQLKKLKSYDIKSALNDPELEEILKEVMD